MRQLTVADIKRRIAQLERLERGLTQEVGIRRDDRDGDVLLFREAQAVPRGGAGRAGRRGGGAGGVGRVGEADGGRVRPAPRTGGRGSPPHRSTRRSMWPKQIGGMANGAEVGRTGARNALSVGRLATLATDCRLLSPADTRTRAGSTS